MLERDVSDLSSKFDELAQAEDRRRRFERTILKPDCFVKCFPAGITGRVERKELLGIEKELD